MNYQFQLETGNRPIDLSHSRLGNINNPLAFNENVGLRPHNAAAGDSVDENYVFRSGSNGTLELLLISNQASFPANSVPLDYNRDHVFSNEADISYSLAGGFQCKGHYKSDDALVGYDDWDNLQLDIEAATAQLQANLSGANDEGMDIQVFEDLEAARLNLDEDGDGTVGLDDNCPYVANPSQSDADGDQVGNACDVCPTVGDADQRDSDADGVGDACDPLSGANEFNLVSDKWVQFGVPLDTGATTLAQLFNGALSAEQYTNEWIVYRYSAQTNQYSTVALNDPLESATGYWIIQITGDVVTVSLSSAHVEPEQVTTTSCGPANTCIFRQLAENTSAGEVQWHLISSALSTPIGVSGIGITIENDQETIFAPVNSLGGNPSVTPVYVYVGDGIYDPLSSANELSDWQGGWLGFIDTEGGHRVGLSVARQ